MIAQVSQSSLSVQSSIPVSGMRNTFCGMCRPLILLLESLSKLKSPTFLSGCTMSMVTPFPVEVSAEATSTEPPIALKHTMLRVFCKYGSPINSAARHFPIIVSKNICFQHLIQCLRTTVPPVAFPKSTYVKFHNNGASPNFTNICFNV